MRPSNQSNPLWLYAGLLAFLPHLLTTIYVTTVRPGFNHKTQYLSELGERGSIAADLFNYFGILPTATLLIIFGLGFAYTQKTHRLLVVAGALIAAHGIFRSLAATFPCDLGCRPITPTTSQVIHNAAASFAFISLTAALFTTAAWLLKAKGHRGVIAISYCLGVLAVFSQALLMVHHGGPTGIYQRLALGALQCWVSIMAITILHRRHSAA